MFGFSLKEKTEKVIEDLFLYAVSSIQRPTFNGLVQNGKALSQNEYSIAFMYMMVMMNSLVMPFDAEEFGDIYPSEFETDEEKSEKQNFVKTHATTILNNIHLANSPESEIKERLSDICSRAGLESIC